MTSKPDRRIIYIHSIHDIPSGKKASCKEQHFYKQMFQTYNNFTKLN